MPKKKIDDDTQPLVIKNRHIMSEGKPLDKTDIADDSEAELPTAPKHEVTVPRDNIDTSAANGQPKVPQGNEEPATSPPAAKDGHTEDTSDTTAKTENVAPDSNQAVTTKAAETNAAAPKPEAEHADQTASDSQPTKASASDEGDKGNPVPDVKKALADAAQTEEREHELESYIEDKKFFVPIDTAAQKKSVKVSIGLTILVVFLAVVLVDLMLDSGVILLVQKIPHTHFFMVKAPSE